MPVLKARIGGAWVDIGGAGGGAEEVFVGPADPGMTYDLWVDSDEPAALTDDLRWNTAWGEIARGTSTIPYGGQQATVDIVTTGAFSTVAGRRLQVTFLANISNGGAANQLTAQITDGANTALQLAGYTVPASASVVPNTVLFTTTSGGTMTFKGRMGGTTPWAVAGSGTQISYISVEDIGPVGGSVPAPSQPTVGLESAKPATPQSALQYFATDTKRLWLWDGTGWIIQSEPPQSYTPTLSGTGWALGSGSATGRYQRQHGSVRIWGAILFGAGMTAGASSLSWSAPMTLQADFNDVGSLRANDTGVNNYLGVVVTGGTAIVPQGPNAGVGNALSGYVTGFPFAWTSGDNIHFTAVARMASVYT